MKFAVHVAPQLMPAGTEVTVPVPDFVTVSAWPPRIVWLRAEDTLAACVMLPEYAAVIERAPSGKALVVHAAEADTTLTAVQPAIAVDPS